MQSKRLLITAISGMTLLFAVPALAVISAPFGWYVEGNVGSSGLSNKSYPGSPSSSGIGINANVGYKLMPYLGLEIGATRTANTNLDDQSGNEAGTDKHWSYDIAARGILPFIDSGLEAFAKIGMAQTNSSFSVNNQTAANNLGVSSDEYSAIGLYYGVGGQYYLTPAVAGNIQWAQSIGNGNTGNMSLLSIGVSFIFA